MIPATVDDPDVTLCDLFDLVRPHMDNWNFDAILSHVNTIYVVNTRPGVVRGGRTTREDAGKSDVGLRLKGEMVAVPESDAILFICSPSVTNLDEMYRKVGSQWSS